MVLTFARLLGPNVGSIWVALWTCWKHGKVKSLSNGSRISFNLIKLLPDFHVAFILFSKKLDPVKTVSTILFDFCPTLINLFDSGQINVGQTGLNRHSRIQMTYLLFNIRHLIFKLLHFQFHLLNFLQIPITGLFYHFQTLVMSNNRHT